VDNVKRSFCRINKFVCLMCGFHGSEDSSSRLLGRYPCSFVVGYRCFRGPCCLHLLGCGAV